MRECSEFSFRLSSGPRRFPRVLLGLRAWRSVVVIVSGGESVSIFVFGPIAVDTVVRVRERKKGEG